MTTLDNVDDGASLSVVVIDCRTGNTTARPFTEAELAALLNDPRPFEAQVVVVDPLDELRQQVADLQALVASLSPKRKAAIT